MSLGIPLNAVELQEATMRDSEKAKIWMKFFRDSLVVEPDIENASDLADLSLDAFLERWECLIDIERSTYN